MIFDGDAVQRFGVEGMKPLTLMITSDLALRLKPRGTNLLQVDRIPWRVGRTSPQDALSIPRCACPEAGVRFLIRTESSDPSQLYDARSSPTL